MRFCIRIHHAGDLLRELEEIYAVFRVATDDLIASNMAQIIAENLLREQIDQCLNIHGHFFFVVGLLKRAEVDVGESRLEELNVECVTKE